MFTLTAPSAAHHAWPLGAAASGAPRVAARGGSERQPARPVMLLRKLHF